MTQAHPQPVRSRTGTTRIRWTIIWLAFAGLSINYLDRASLSVALPFMGRIST